MTGVSGPVGTLPATRRLGHRTSRALLYAFVAVAVAANLVIVALILNLMAQGQNQADWSSWVEAGRRAWAGLPLYDWTPGVYEFRYSPLMAYLFGLIAPIGIVGWRLLELGSLLLLPRRLALAAVVSIPLWLDLYAGNVMTPLFVLAACALAGRSWAIGGFFIAAVLVPKPLLLPVMIWMLWKHPEWRVPFTGIVVVNGVAVLLTGSGGEWLGSLLAGRYDLYAPFELGPARVIGLAWVPIGIALAAWLTWKGRLGYASLAASPYWLPYYLLFGLLELRSESVSPDAVVQPSIGSQG